MFDDSMRDNQCISLCSFNASLDRPVHVVVLSAEYSRECLDSWGVVFDKTITVDVLAEWKWEGWTVASYEEHSDLWSSTDFGAGGGGRHED